MKEKDTNRYQKIKVCNEMTSELINYKAPVKNRLAFKLARKKDLKEIRETKKKLNKQTK